jgi:hypothetical protein
LIYRVDLLLRTDRRGISSTVPCGESISAHHVGVDHDQLRAVPRAAHPR